MEEKKIFCFNEKKKKGKEGGREERGEEETLCVVSSRHQSHPRLGNWERGWTSVRSKLARLWVLFMFVCLYQEWKYYRRVRPFCPSRFSRVTDVVDLLELARRPPQPLWLECYTDLEIGMPAALKVNTWV